MTPEKVAKLTSLYEELEEAEVELEAFCYKVALLMREDWKSVESVKISNGYVCFTAHWYGSFQSHESEHFQFPTELLTEGEEGALAYCKANRKERR